MNEVDVKQSAYKHGLTYDDIMNCYRYPIVTKVLRTDDSTYLYIGFDTNGRPIEVLANHNGISVIFHTMKLRKVFEKFIK